MIFSKSNYGISIVSSRLTSISCEVSFIVFPLLLDDGVLFLDTSLGVGEGVSPLGRPDTLVLETKMVALA